MSNPRTTAKKKNPTPSCISRFPWNTLIIVLAIAGFVFACVQLDLVQDDAYISFRYAANFLSGHGLVYNYGERVEGYTNFLWVMLLAFFKGIFGVNFLTFARTAGVLFGVAILLLLAVMLKDRFTKVPPVYSGSLFVLLVTNLSFSYWSVSGLETAAFTCMALASIVSEYRRPQLTPILLIIATLLRPEGALVFGIVLINRILQDRKIPWQYILLYSLPLMPFVVFKLVYYGSLFPNPYYAKSGVGLEYIKSGLEYVWYFARTAGVYGFVFLIPLLAIRNLWKRYSLLYLYVIIYTLYIIWVGGDVLKVYRFFVPVLPVLYFLFVLALVEFAALLNVSRKREYAVVVLGSLIFSATSFQGVYQYVKESRDTELNFMERMRFTSTMLKNTMGPSFSLATSTIGIAGYQLLGHRVIDMLGLTDPYIARTPETIEGMSAPWKERRYNSGYLLAQQPDFILFSTGYKPSSPAERALMLHSEFRRTYSTIGFFDMQGLCVVWRRTGPITMAKDRLTTDLEFVNAMNEGLQEIHQGHFEKALARLRDARRHLGEDYAMLSSSMGECMLSMNDFDNGVHLLQQAIALDSLCWEARDNLVNIARARGDTATVLRHTGVLKRQFPWMFH
jgi:hypothetical protein